MTKTRRAVTFSRERGNRPNEAYGLAYLGEAYLELGRWDEARLAAADSVGIARDIGLHDALCVGLTILGRYFSRTGDPDAALRTLLEAVGLNVRGLPLADGLVELARTWLDLEDLARALEAAVQALDICEASGLRLCQGRALVVLAQVRLARGSTADAFDHASEALALQRETEHLVGQAEAHAVLARCELDEAKAAEHLDAARQIYARTGATPAPGVGLTMAHSNA